MELDPVAVGLKFGFLAVLYLFLLWVARSALRDLRRGAQEDYTGPSADYEEATGMYSASAPLGRDGGTPRLRVHGGAGLQAGFPYDLSHGAALGRGGQGGNPLRGGDAASPPCGPVPPGGGVG